jgi:hypothetical protein
MRRRLCDIDPFSYDDPATRRRLLYWGSVFEPIRPGTSPDRISFAPQPPDRSGAVVRTEDPPTISAGRKAPGSYAATAYYYLLLLRR